jgi:hypothetical protein
MEFRLRGGSGYNDFRGDAIKLAIFYLGWIYIHCSEESLSNRAATKLALDGIFNLVDEEGNFLVSTVIGEYSTQHGNWESLTPSQLNRVAMPFFLHGMAWATRELFPQLAKKKHGQRRRAKAAVAA